MRELLYCFEVSSCMPASEVTPVIVAGMPLLEHAPPLQASPVDAALVYGSAGSRGGSTHAPSHAACSGFCAVRRQTRAVRKQHGLPSQGV